ncbi:unnamed protein product [Knipowitschia caucasica]|uniref:Nuclear protein MDM1 n=1 Tax=Knipowitschia caucasica TaxID=637954 RepID=A0AAV2IW70_KNICA
MKVRFKSQTEYQRSYRSRSASPLRSAQFAGLRSDHMGISQEPCFQRRKKFNSHHPPLPWRTVNKSANENAAAAEPGPLPTGQPSEKTMVTEKHETSDQSQQHKSYSPILLNSQETSRNNALRKKAGLKLTRSALHKTEYNRQFGQKMAPAAPSPMLTANEALRSSHIIPPFKNHPVAMDTEYQRSFKGIAPTTSPRLRKKLENEITPLFYTHVDKNTKLPKNKPNPRNDMPSPEVKVDKQQSSPKEMFPDSTLSHSKTHRVLTEYESRFCSPEEINDTTSHTPQIKALREQALQYRRRAWGTHFSRDHLSQLLSEHNALWEPTGTIESLSERPESICLDLCQISSAGPVSSRDSCLEVLDLASNSSCKDSDVCTKGEKNSKMSTTNAETPQRTPNVVAEDTSPLPQNDESDGEEGGRLQTPEMKLLPIQRTHHDRTTPAAVGGAILVGKPLETDEVCHKSSTTNSVHILKPREAWTDSRQHKQAPKPIASRITPPLPPPLSSTVPFHCIQGTLRNADFQHNGPLGLRLNTRKCGTACCSDEDDHLSVMSSLSAASCTRASAVLKRAQRRRGTFWGET